MDFWLVFNVQDLLKVLSDNCDAMEESFSDLDDLKSLLLMSDGDVVDLFEADTGDFFDKVETFKLGLKENISGPGENLVESKLI